MSKCLAVAGLIFGIFGIACSAFAQYDHYWKDVDVGLYHGVWKFSFSTQDGNWPDDVQGYTKNDRLHGYIVRYATLGGSVLMLLSMIFILAFICGQGKRAFAAVAGVFCMLSAGAHAAAVTLFRLKFELVANEEFGRDVYLATAAGGLGLFAAFFKIIAALRSGTKVETIEPALNSDRSNKSNKSNQGNKGNQSNRSNQNKKGNQNNQNKKGNQNQNKKNANNDNQKQKGGAREEKGGRGRKR